jgi:hypothetical protein
VLDRIRHTADEPQAQTEPGGVGARAHPRAVVADDRFDELAMRHRHRDGDGARLVAPEGVDHGVADRLGEREPKVLQQRAGDAGVTRELHARLVNPLMAAG